jgi:hypothetical protein
VRGIIFQHATQLGLVEHDQAIESFAPERTDEALDLAVVISTSEFGF